MQNLISNQPQLITALLLILSIITVWFRYSWLWKSFFWAFVASGIITGALEPIALTPIIGLAVLVYLFYCVDLSEKIRIIILLGILLLPLALGLHLLPGFNNWQVYESIKLSDISAPFSIWYYYDKPLIGLFILAALSNALNRSITDWKEMLCRVWKVMIIGILSVYVLSYALDYARFDLSVNEAFIPWAIKNLFLVVIAEEAYFRGIIQNQLQHYIKHDKAGLIAAVIAGVLFGIAHFAGGIMYVILASVAGVLYGYVYYKTNRIEAVILAHFLLNIGHFIFFTYPFYLSS